MRLYFHKIYDMDKLSTVKCFLRGLTIPFPNGITIKQLDRDYIDMIGEKSIPFTKLGFNRLEDFLKSLPDTLTVNYFCNKCHLTKLINYSFFFLIDNRNWTFCSCLSNCYRSKSTFKSYGSITKSTTTNNRKT